jgi:hypothetical protein
MLLISALDVREWSTSRFGRSTLWERFAAPTEEEVGMDPTAGQDNLENRKFLSLAGKGTPDGAARSLVTLPTAIEMRVSYILYVYYYYYYYLLQLSFHSVAAVLTLVTNKNK